MDKNTKIIVYGLIVWLVPFLISVFLYPQGQPIYDLQVIKSVFIVVGASVGALLALWYLRDGRRISRERGRSSASPGSSSTQSSISLSSFIS